MRLLTCIIATFALFSTACTATAQTTDKGDKKTLIVYFSYGGNTKAMAERIGRATGAEIFEIKASEPYAKDYQAVLERAKREIDNDIRPSIEGEVVDFAGYDTVFVGTPCWCGTIAPPLSTFLALHDLSGKTVVPFMTHGGSGFAKGIEAIERLCPKASVTEGLAVRGGAVDQSDEQISEWLRRIGID